MPGVGVGGLFANLFNPGLDDRLAQHITPNPNPWPSKGVQPRPGLSTASATQARWRPLQARIWPLPQ